MKCTRCGKKEETNALCPKGHYVCNDCHGKDILSLVRQLCEESSLTDPVALLLEVFQLPGLNMHGPEYHSIVPAVLVAAYNNSQGIKNPLAVEEAIRRGRDVKGAFCGTHGACGAGLGTGVAYSIIHGATPYSKRERGGTLEMTSLALMEISKLGGPRCCKREAVTAVETFKKHVDSFTKTENAKYICSQHAKNKECLRRQCPYYPEK